MPRRTASQMRISASERAALKITRADLRERRRSRFAYRAAHRASDAPISVAQNPARWAKP